MGGDEDENRNGQGDRRAINAMYTLACIATVGSIFGFWRNSTDSFRYGFTYDNYTSLWNVLDYCATTLPVTRVSLDEDIEFSHEARNDSERDVWKSCRFNPMEIWKKLILKRLARHLRWSPGIGPASWEAFKRGVSSGCNTSMR